MNLEKNHSKNQKSWDTGVLLSKREDVLAQAHIHLTSQKKHFDSVFSACDKTQPYTFDYDQTQKAFVHKNKTPVFTIKI